jgi:disulfide bond formation protein DsbB
MSKKPNPYPQSDHVVRAKSITYAALQGECYFDGERGCPCTLCVARRIAYVAGWKACRVAGRKGKR